MASHVLWDAFTHNNAYFVTRIPFLTYYMNMFGEKIAVYKVLQHGSTLTGFGIMFVYLHMLTRRVDRVLPKGQIGKRLSFWGLVLLVAMGVVIFRAFYTLDGISLAYFGIYCFIVSFISGLMCPERYFSLHSPGKY